MRPAGWGTKHIGEGRCKLHGGCSTGPKDRAKASASAKISQKGNSKAMEAGEFEKIVIDELRNDEEKRKFKSIPDVHAMNVEIKILRFKMLRLLTPVERQVLMGIGDGMVEVGTLEVDEVTKALALERLADGVRKIMRDMKDTDKEHDTFEELLDHVRLMRDNNPSKKYEQKDRLAKGEYSSDEVPEV